MDICFVDMDIFCGDHHLGFGSLTLGYHVLFNLAVAPLCWIGMCVNVIAGIIINKPETKDTVVCSRFYAQCRPGINHVYNFFEVRYVGINSKPGNPKRYR